MPFAQPPIGATGYVIVLDQPSFYILLGILALFAAMFALLRADTRSQRALEGFLEATAVDVAFLLFSILLLIYLDIRYPRGSHVAWALSQVILQGYWLTFAIPIMTVGMAVHSSTSGYKDWRTPALLIAVGLFVVLFYWVYVTGA